MHFEFRALTGRACLRALPGLIAVCWGWLALPDLAHAAATENEDPPLDYVIVVTGGEILEGLYPDAHTPYLTRTLRPLGGRCLGAITVDDRESDLNDALRFGLSKAPLVIVTGGLGPTPNDITRETIAAFTGITLHEHEEVVAAMERRFGQPREQLRPNLRRQALVPSSGAYFTNTVGTAVGLLFNTTNAVIAALPGPPRELQPMVERELMPFLRTRFGLRPPGSTLTLRFVGLGQSQISQTLQDHMKLPPGLVITSQFDAGRVDFTFTLPGQTDADRQWLAELVGTMRNLLGDNLYADDDSTLEAQVLRAFARRGLTLALIEIGSGGHIASSLAGTIGFDRVLLGSIVAPSEPSLRQILGVGNPTATGKLHESAHAARDRSHADVVVVIELQGVVPGEPGNVRITWVDGGYRETQFPWTDASPGSRAVLTTRVIDWLRRQVEVK